MPNLAKGNVMNVKTLRTLINSKRYVRLSGKIRQNTAL